MLPATILPFLEDLKQNNYREWFQANQKRYAEYKKNYKAVTEALIREVSTGDESLKHLEFKNCSFRINRDIRFSKDKSPYKTNMGIWLSAGNKEFNMGGYYLHIEKGASFIAGGLHMPDPVSLKKMRREIAGFYEDLEEILENKEFKKLYGTLDREQSLKTAPKDYDKDHPAIEFLKLKSFTVTHKLSDKDLASKNFIEETAKKMLVMQPFIEYINRAMTTEE